MKKFIKYIFVGLAASLVAVSCDINDLKFLNNEPVFDDANAFVAFDQTAVTIAEDCPDVIQIPVTLASVAGLEESISFEITYPEEKAAQQGVNFDIKNTSGVLTFNSRKRTDYILVSASTDGVYTGDLKFNIVLNDGATIATGAANTCVVTITDIDHPLSAILGSYTVTSSNGAYTNPWKITLYKDASDDHKVWIDNLMANTGWAIATTRYYGNVNQELTNINIPFGQESVYLYSGTTPLTLFGLTADDGIYDTGSIDATITYNADGTVKGLVFDPEWGLYFELVGLGYVGYWYPSATAEKD